MQLTDKRFGKFSYRKVEINYLNFFRMIKKLIKFAAFRVIAVFVLVGCIKPIGTEPQQQTNKPPVANAGADVVAQSLSCAIKKSITELDGSRSSDPDNNIVGYSWALLYGPAGYILRNSNLARATLESVSSGIYALELRVTDHGGLYSKDTVVVEVQGNSGVLTEYNLDISLTATFNFLDNYLDNYFDPWDVDFYYYDEIHIRSNTIIQTLGEFQINVFEIADSAALSDSLYGNYLEIDNVANPFLYINGDLSGINFKKLIREGGGSFSGSFTINSGEAQSCDTNIFANLPPLIVTGILNVTTQIVTLKIKGKVYF
jgi:hypothetical protein